MSATTLSKDSVTASTAQPPSARKADPACAPGGAVYGEVLEFLYQEAELLDDCRFQDWIGLFSDDIHYTMPVRTTQFRTQGAGFQDVSFFDDNLNSLRTRVQRLQTDAAWAETPPSRTRHFLTNVLVGLGERANEYAVSANFMVTRSRGEQGYQLFTGRREDLLRRLDSGALRIARRRLLIDQTVITGTNLSILF
jgi:biphenyl 2,3-dioxygenase beta subunit/benzene/toluene dioxygenase beta subunit